MVTGWDAYFMDLESEQECNRMSELRRMQDGIDRLRTLLAINGGPDVAVVDLAYQAIISRDQKIVGLYDTIAERNDRIRARALAASLADLEAREHDRTVPTDHQPQATGAVWWHKILSEFGCQHGPDLPPFDATPGWWNMLGNHIGLHHPMPSDQPQATTMCTCGDGRGPCRRHPTPLEPLLDRPRRSRRRTGDESS